MKNALVIGAGLSGCTAANLLADAGYNVVVKEKSNCPGGNVRDFVDPTTGLLVHRFGPHAFHTDDQEVWNYVHRFASWKNFALHVEAELTNGLTVPVPFNDVSQDVIDQIGGGQWGEEEIENEIFLPYSKKMWGVSSLDELPSHVRNRVPKRRFSTDERYHLDEYQGVPIDGYSKFICNMLQHPGIRLQLGVDDRRSPIDTAAEDPERLVIYTGPLDSMFGQPGALPYRTIDFTFQYVPVIFLPIFEQLNFCHDRLPYTRAVNHAIWSAKSFVSKDLPRSVISYETPRDYRGRGEDDDINPPMYPVDYVKAQSFHAKAQKLPKNLIPLGRLATYKYLDMDDCIKIAFQKLAPFIKP